MRYLLLVLLGCFITAATATAQITDNFVRYAPAEGEYSILLPEAPTVTTLWANSKLPGTYMITPMAGLATLGETATYQRTDSDTGDTILVRLSMLRADPSSLAALTEEKMTAALEQELAGLTLEKKQVSFSGGSQTLKWGILTAYHLDDNNRMTYNAVHYLAGLQTISVVRISFTLENRRYKNMYETIGKSIKYTGK